MDIEERLIETYKRYTGAKNGWGSKTWIARVTGMHPTSVYRIMSGKIPNDRINVTLDMIDQMIVMRDALEVIRDYREVAGLEPALVAHLALERLEPLGSGA